MAQFINQTGYGLSQAIQNLAPFPIKANRAPNAADKGYVIGQLWIYSATNTPYILTSIVNNAAVWELLFVSGGTGIFSSLTVTGNSNLTGTTNINISGAANTVIGGVLNTGTVGIGGINSSGVTILAPILDLDTTADGTINIGDSLVDGDLNIGNNITTGLITIANSLNAGQILFGNPVSAGDMNIYGESIQLASAGTGRLYLNAAGQVEVATITDIIASPGTTAVIDARVGYATFTGFTTAAGASQVFTITNNKAALASAMLVTANNLGANDAQMTVTRVTPGVGTFDVTLTNNGAAALNGDINISFWLYN